MSFQPRVQIQGTVLCKLIRNPESSRNYFVVFWLRLRLEIPCGYKARRGRTVRNEVGFSVMHKCFFQSGRRKISFCSITCSSSLNSADLGQRRSPTKRRTLAIFSQSQRRTISSGNLIRRKIQKP